MDKRKISRAVAQHPLQKITTVLSSDIVLFHILPRLPVKSVLRFKCVSKQWHSFLTTSMFQKMHFHHVSTKKMVVLSTTTPFKFQIIDCERPKDGFTAGRPLPFPVPPQALRVRILTSVHGIVCVGIIKERRRPYDMDRCIDLVLWNPATGDHKTLPKHFDEDEDCYLESESLFGLYHSAWDDDYKLLQVTHHPKVYIYSLKSDSWRKVKSDLQPTRDTFSVMFLSYIWVPSDLVDEIMYFLQYIEDEYSVIKFNTKTETLELIETRFLENKKTTWLSFRVLRDGCIHLWVNIENSSTWSQNELWRMDKDGDWTKVESWGMILSDPTPYDHHRLHLMRNGNLLMYDGSCVYQLDMKTHTKDVCSYTTEHMPVVWPGGKYIETMVSPNLYVK